jgi:hypothetical protein
MSRFWKEYGSKLFSLFIVITMLTVVYPVLVDTAKNPSQLSVYDDDWNDISEFASDLNKDSNGKHEIKTIVSRPSIMDKISEIEKNSTDQTVNVNQTVLVIIGVEKKYSDYDSKAIYNFVSAGGTVLLAADGGYANSAFNGEQDIGIQWWTNNVQEGCEPKTNEQTTIIGDVASAGGYGYMDPKCKPARLYDANHWNEEIHPKNNSIVIIDANIDRMNFDGQLMMSSPSALKLGGGKNAEGLAFSTQQGFVDLNQNGEGGPGESTHRNPADVGEEWPEEHGREVVAETNIGEGKIVVISDTSIFTNRYYNQLDNKEFITQLFEYLTDGEKNTIIFDESRHIQGDFVSLIYVQLFGILGYVSSSEALGILFLGGIILILQIVMMRVENPKPWRHLFNIYEGRLSRFRVPHAHYTHPETIKEVFIEKVRIDNGFTREEFEMLAPSKIEELLGDPILIRFIINNEKNMTLSQVEQSIKRWKK